MMLPTPFLSPQAVGVYNTLQDSVQSRRACGLWICVLMCLSVRLSVCLSVPLQTPGG